MIATTPTTLTTLASPVAPLDGIRVVLALAVFAYAAYRDVLERKVKDVVWAPLIVFGVIFIVRDLYVGDFGTLLPLYTLNIILAALIGTLGYRLRLFYGADMKAIIALGVLFPVFPALGSYPVYQPLPHQEPFYSLDLFIFAFILNTALVSLVYPLYLFGQNIRDGTHHTKNPLLWLTARRVHISDAGEGYGKIIQLDPTFHQDTWYSKLPLLNRVGAFIYGSLYGLDSKFISEYVSWRQNVIKKDPIEHFGELSGRVYLERFLADQPEDGWRSDAVEEDAKDLQTLAQNEFVWVTPGIPYIVPMFFGLIITFTLGNPVYLLIFF